VRIGGEVAMRLCDRDRAGYSLHVRFNTRRPFFQLKTIGQTIPPWETTPLESFSTSREVINESFYRLRFLINAPN
jgi:hypothetical protein